MKQTILLVHRGISALTHPVSGKSLKHYGTAVQSPSHKGVVFKMELSAYTEAAHDLIGNVEAGQQWVPEIIYEADGVSRGKCCIPAGCPREADYQFGSDLYCAGHSPNNATPLYPGAPPIGTGNLPAGVTPDVLPRIVEKAPTLVEKGQQQQLPVENLTPTVGTPREGEEAPFARAVPIEKPVPIPSAASMPGPASSDAGAAPAPAPEQSVAEKQQQAIEVIGGHVIEKVLPALEAKLETLVGGLAERLLAKNNGKPQKRRTGGPNLAPSAFKVLQQRAKSLGINVFQKNSAALAAEIAAKENPLT